MTVYKTIFLADVDPEKIDCFEASTSPLIQQTKAWRSIIRTSMPDQDLSLAVIRDGRIVATLGLFCFPHPKAPILQSIPGAGGYGGIVISPDVREDALNIVQPLWDRVMDIAREHGCSLISICTPPFSGLHEVLRACRPPDYTLENFFQYLEIRPDITAGLPSVDRNDIKRNIRIANTANVVCREAESDADFETWYIIHQKRMTELAVPPLPHEYLKTIWRTLAPKYAFLMLAEQQHRIIGGGLFVGNPPIIDAFMISMDSDFADLRANYLVIISALDASLRRGFRILNWQSSPSRDSSVYRWKQKWGSLEGSHHYLTYRLGDLSWFKKLGPQGIRREYPWHFVIPFNALEAIVE